MLLLKLFIAILAFGVGCFATNPGALLAISQSGINTAHDIVVPIILQKLENTKIPDVHQTTITHRCKFLDSFVTDVPVLGHFDVDITQITLRGFHMNSRVEVRPNVGFTFIVTELTTNFWAEWHYRKVHWPHISDHGTADAGISRTTIVVTIAVGEANGRPTVSTAADNVNIGGFNLKLHGGASWLYNIFIHLFEGSIKHNVEKAIHDGILKAINERAEDFLQRFPFVAPINHFVEIDYLIPDRCTFGNGFASFPFKGEIKAIQNPVEYPVPPPPLPVQSPPRMLRIILSEYTFGSAGFAYWKANRLHTSVNNHNLPPNFPLRLNTSDWRYIIPGLYKSYPNLEMQIDLFVSDAPKVVISPSGIDLTVQGNLVLSVIRSSVLIPCVIIALSTENDIYARLVGTTLIPSITFESFNMKLTNSTVGPIGDLDGMNKVITFLLKNIVVPVVNDILASGFPLPVIKDTALVNPTLTFSNHYLIVDTDFRPSQNELMIHNVIH